METKIDVGTEPKSLEEGFAGIGSARCHGKGLNGSAYDALARLPIVRDYEIAFRCLTGMSVKLVPGSVSVRPDRVVAPENPFCHLVTRTTGGCETCRNTEALVYKEDGKSPAPRTFCCFAGLQGLAVPVVVEERHVATLLGGPVFRSKPRRQDFGRVARQLLEWGLDAELPRAEKAYFHTCVVTGEQLRAMLRLLTIFARHLAEYANSCLIEKRADEPPCVASAKEFARARAGERVSMREAAGHVHLSAHYFCRIFRKATGMTFTEHLSRVRIEKAKGLLADPFARVSEVAYASGFGSVPHFNSVFRKYVGKSPTEYRAALGWRDAPWPGPGQNSVRKSQPASSVFVLRRGRVTAKQI